MLVSDIETSVRPQINDTDATDYNWASTTHFVPACAFAQRVILRLCPNARLDSKGEKLRDLTAITAASSAFIFLSDQEDLYRDPVEAFVKHWLYQAETEDGPDIAKAVNFYKMGLAYLKGSNG